MQRCFEFAVAAAGTIGEDIAKEGTFDEETIDEEVGYEETDFLDDIFSNQDTKKLVGLIVMPNVTKS